MAQPKSTQSTRTKVADCWVTHANRGTLFAICGNLVVADAMRHMNRKPPACRPFLFFVWLVSFVLVAVHTVYFTISLLWDVFIAKPMMVKEHVVQCLRVGMCVRARQRHWESDFQELVCCVHGFILPFL